MTETVSNYIDGKWTPSSATSTLPITNSATGAEIGRTPLSPASDVEAAVQAARRAYPMWRATPAVDRARVLFRLKALLDENREALARSVTVEHGKILLQQWDTGWTRCAHL